MSEYVGFKHCKSYILPLVSDRLHHTGEKSPAANVDALHQKKLLCLPGIKHRYPSRTFRSADTLNEHTRHERMDVFDKTNTNKQWQSL